MCVGKSEVTVHTLIAFGEKGVHGSRVLVRARSKLLDNSVWHDNIFRQSNVCKSEGTV